MRDPLEFYRTLPVAGDFSGVADFDAYRTVPDDWSLFVADVADSTGAIRAGRYKEVNMAGASILAAAFNELESIDLPFIFGGDGATLALPDSLADRVAPALAAAARAASDTFGLTMRLGRVSVKNLRLDGFPVALARIRLHGDIALAAFSGHGVAEAERRVKKLTREHAVPDTGYAADFSGLECRWNGIPAPEGLMLSVLVTPTGNPHESLGEILRLIRETHPESSPVDELRLSITTSPEKLAAENRLRGHALGKTALAARLLWLRLHTTVGRRLIEWRVRLPFADLRRYKAEVVAQSDHRKYDGTLRLVLASSPAKRAELERGLEALFRKKVAAYGVHAAPEALMTCLVFNRSGLHLHFIDVDQGGYAAAAVDLKRRLTELGA